MGNLYDEHIPELIENFNSVDAIIFDIRNYPNGTFWTLVDYFFETSLHITNLKHPEINYPGTFFWYEDWIGEGCIDPVRKKIILLFNEETLSQAEYTCMGLEQIPGAIKIGSTTAAADGNISYILLPGGITAMASFLGVFYPDYTPTQRIGIIPDYEVLPTIQGIREGRDEVLEFALNCEFVGVEEVTKKEGIRVYPNPTSGELIITSDELQVTSIEVFDIFGRRLLSNYHITLSSHHLINISHVPQGVYIVKIIANGDICTRKIIKTN